MPYIASLILPLEIEIKMVVMCVREKQLKPLRISDVVVEGR